MANLKPAKKIQGILSPLDVQNLLAAIHRLEQVHGQQFPVEDDQDECIPANSPTRDTLRLKRALDALAGFCVSKSEDEVIALSIEYVKISNRKRRIIFFIASNSEVTDTTQQHLRDMWQSMQNMASIYHSSRQSDERSELFDSFAQLCLSFSFDKWKKRIKSGISSLLAIPIDDLPENHPFVTVRRYIHVLTSLYTRESPIIGKPDEDRMKWRQYRLHLKETRDVIRKFIETNPFDQDERYSIFPSMKQYLSKARAPLDQLDILQASTRSPQCRHLFTHPFDIEALHSMSIATTIPQTAKDWEEVLEKAASVHKEEYMVNMDIISKDAESMASMTTQNTSVHSELQLALHAIKNHKTYSYIGLSKPSCYGCQVFLSALNTYRNTKFLTRSNGKVYPWQFPGHFYLEGEVASMVYKSVAKALVTGYQGYQRNPNPPVEIECEEPKPDGFRSIAELLPELKLRESS